VIFVRRYVIRAVRMGGWIGGVGLGRMGRRGGVRIVMRRCPGERAKTRSGEQKGSEASSNAQTASGATRNEARDTTLLRASPPLSPCGWFLFWPFFSPFNPLTQHSYTHLGSVLKDENERVEGIRQKREFFFAALKCQAYLLMWRERNWFRKKKRGIIRLQGVVLGIRQRQKFMRDITNTYVGRANEVVRTTAGGP